MPELEVGNQLYLNMAISVSLWKALDSLSVKNVAIKWPNDILVDGKKIAGILIENSLSGSLIKNSIIGVGLNVKQIEFVEFKRQATSLKKELGETIDIQVVLERVLEDIKTEYLKLKKGRFQEIKEAYLDELYGYKKQMEFEDKDGSFSAQIIGVDEHGRLMLQKEEGSVNAYRLKEVAFKA
jgi:BirA family biotin operon repressor/biotin-[acetyl-CoA-carboxylase] ligase